MKNLLILALALCLSASVMGQTSTEVRGRLTEPPVARQTVRLVSTQATFVTETDENGDYRFSGVPDGQYLLIAQGRQANVTVRGGSVTMTNLADVVVIAASETQTTEEISRTVNVITAQEMRDRADITAVDALRTVPGFRVQQLGGFGRTASIKSRGLRNQDTALLIDGIRFRDATAITGDATPFLSDITLTSVDRLEVLRGPGSSMYGTNAIGGAVDLRTPEARSGTHGQVGGAFGGLGLGRFRGNLSHGTQRGRFGASGALSRTVYTKGIDGDDDSGNTNVQARLDGRPTGRTALSGRIFFSDAFVKLNVNPDTLGSLPASNRSIIQASAGVNFLPDANDPDNTQDSRFYLGQVSFDHAFSNEIGVSGYYQGLSTSRININGPLGPGFQSASTSIFDGTIHTGNISLNLYRGRDHRFRAGYEIERETFVNEGFTPSGTDDFATRDSQTSHTVFAQHLASFGDLHLSAGARVQGFRSSIPRFTPSSGAYSGAPANTPPTAYTLDGSAAYFFRSSGTKIRIHVGRGYRVPSLYERFGTFYSTFGTPQFVALGDPQLAPERSWAVDAGVDQEAAEGKVRLSATYFYNRLSNTIGFANVAPPIGSTARPFGGYVNQKGGTSRGAEFSTRVRPFASTEVFASYTYTNSDQLQPQVTGTGYFRTLGVPDHQVTAVVTQRWRRFWINLDLLATSDYVAPIFSGSTFQTYIYRFRGNRRVDVTAGYTFLPTERLSVRLFGTVENIGDQTYFENGFRTPGRNARVGLSLAF